VSLGKQIRIEMTGKETELDRTVLEAIKDPLTHIVRNSVDHGIESPEVRGSKNKPRTGTLRLRAYHEGGQVNIEIADDGGGLKLEAIQKKAIERGLITAERASRLSQHERTQLVFLPGFSTAEKVTNVSGRGVGMDVVKTNIERIGGTVEIFTAPGKGTTIKIKIPLTLAIVPALIVTGGEQRYAIPQGSLVELVGLDGDQARQAIEWVHGTPVYRLRGRLLPLVSLNEQLGHGDRLRAVIEANRPTSIVVLSADDRQFGLVVDEVRDTEEIVVKPLGKELKGITVFAGATIMGDGRVALILDVLGLAQHANAVSRVREHSHRERSRSVADEGGKDAVERQAWLLFGVGDEGTMAVPLAQVARLEEFPKERLERTGRRSVVQYRGNILPLIELDSLVGVAARTTEDASLSVIVYSEGNRSIGFVVRQILDVVEDGVNVERMSSQPGVLGAAVVQGRVTDLLDVRGLIRAHEPQFFEGLDDRSAA
jgi:two-component system, chemotaxis family, sensor kinase CheA